MGLPADEVTKKNIETLEKGLEISIEHIVDKYKERASLMKEELVKQLPEITNFYLVTTKTPEAIIAKRETQQNELDNMMVADITHASGITQDEIQQFKDFIFDKNANEKDFVNLRKVNDNSYKKELAISKVCRDIKPVIEKAKEKEEKTTEFLNNKIKLEQAEKIINGEIALNNESTPENINKGVSR